MLPSPFSTCENKVDKEADKEGKEGEGGETPGEGNSPGVRQGEREASKRWGDMGEMQRVKSSTKSSRNQSRSHGVEHNREMAGKPVGQSESAHPADVLDQVVGAMAVGGQQSEEAE